MNTTMNYYEKLVRNIDRSMKAHPRSAMVMNMNNFDIIARGPNFKSLGKKMAGAPGDISTIVFQKRNQKAAWIL
jgi:hypothetical protein